MSKADVVSISTPNILGSLLSKIKNYLKIEPVYEPIDAFNFNKSISDSEALKSRMCDIEDVYKSLQYISALQTVLTIIELKDNWNDNGAKPFEGTLIRKCFDLLITLKNSPPEIFPVADNSIQMEYDGGDGSYLQFRIYEDKIREFCVLSDGQKITKHIESSEIPEEVKRFYEQLRK